MTETETETLEPLWWHVYGAEVPGLAKSDETGEPRPGWMQVTLGGCTVGPDDVRESGEPVKQALDITGNLLDYLGSWDHEPFDQEIAPLVPENYRD